MEKKLNWIKKPLNAYVIISLVTVVVFFARVLLSHGLFLNNFFWSDNRDSLMDFFHSIEYTRGRAPYFNYETLYPPLANLCFWVLFRCIPTQVSEVWPQDFEISQYMRGSFFDLRTFQAPMICFLVFFMVCITLTTCILAKIFDQHLLRYQFVGVFLCFSSYGFLYAMERGNILLLVFPLILFFVLYHGSSERRIREISYLMLAFAVGLKIYPGIFFFLLLKERKVKDFIRCMVYCLLSVVVPMFFFREGIRGFEVWIKVMMSYSADASEISTVGNGLSSILAHLQVLCSDVFGISWGSSWYTKASVLVCLLLILTALVSKKNWESLLALTLGMTLLSTQGEYIYICFLIPLLFFLMQEDVFTKENVIPFAMLMVIVLPVPLAYKHKAEIIQYYPANTMRQTVLLLMLVWVIWQGIAYIKSIKRAEKY